MKYLLLIALLLCGCQNAGEKIQQETTKIVETSKQTMDDLMDHFKNAKIEFDELTDLKETSFANHAGKSFKLGDSYAYIYHLDTSDESMKTLLKQIQHDGTLDISINDEIKPYQAIVNGEFIFLYDQKADAQEIADVFKRY